MNKITSKIQKLISLSNSSNEEEANLAFAKAKALAMKYDLDLEMAAILGDEHEEKQPFGKDVAFKGSRMPVINKYIIHILQDYFKVKVVYSTVNRKTQISFVGRLNDIEIAKEIYNQLLKTFDWLWKNYKAKNSLKNDVKCSYLWGLNNGLISKLDMEKEKTIEDKILELPEDIQESSKDKLQLAIVTESKLLEDNFRNMHPTLGKYKTKYGRISRGDVYSDGFSDGKSVNLGNSTKALTC